jgi:hypothetical protein
MANRRRIVRRRTGKPGIPENRVQLRQEWVTLENTERVEPFLDGKRRILVKLEHKVQEVISVLTSPSGYAVEFEFKPGEKTMSLDWEKMQAIPGPEAIVVEYYEALPFDTAEAWERLTALVNDLTSGTTERAVVEFLLRKIKAKWPDVFAKVIGKEEY